MLNGRQIRCYFCLKGMRTCTCQDVVFGNKLAPLELMPCKPADMAPGDHFARFSSIFSNGYHFDSDFPPSKFFNDWGQLVASVLLQCKAQLLQGGRILSQEYDHTAMEHTYQTKYGFSLEDCLRHLGIIGKAAVQAYIVKAMEKFAVGDVACSSPIELFFAGEGVAAAGIGVARTEALTTFLLHLRSGLSHICKYGILPIDYTGIRIAGGGHASVLMA